MYSKDDFELNNDEEINLLDNLYSFKNMESKRLLLFLFCLITYHFVNAQSIDLEEISVSADRKQKQGNSGAKMTEIEQVEIERNNTKSLSELLLENSSLQIKSMGQGAMTTVSFRGTSSSHTQVLWNGISINSPQLGNFDFSQIPVYFVDDVYLHHGSSAQDAGSGGLGGTINMKSNSSLINKPSLSVLAECGSNSTYTGGITIKLPFGRLMSSTRLYYQQSENNYKYLNKVYDVKPFYERRKDADYKEGGAMQEFHYFTTKGDKLSAIAWWQTDDRSLPQIIIVEATPNENSKSDNFRSLISYEGKRNDKHLFKTTFAYLNSKMEYQRTFGYDTTKTENKNYSYIVCGEYSFTGFRNIYLKSNITYRYDNVSSDNYAAGKCDRHSVLASLMGEYRLHRNFKIDGKVTSEKVDSHFYTIYNTSVKYNIIDDYLTLKATNSYNYRIPSLNDLYWNPGGNPDLKPEKGFSSDISFAGNINIGNLSTNYDITYYYMDINNWIMWIPKGNGYFWEPVNFNKVNSQGIEINYGISLKIKSVVQSIKLNYGYTRSVDKSGRDDGTYNSQIPYVPVNRWNIGYRFNLNEKLWFYYGVTFTDIRFTSADKSYYTNAYTIHNAESGYKLKFRNNYSIDFILKADNIFNAYYESTQYYPMPLRMFRGSIRVNF